jgi:hypothetical protein
MRTALFLAAGLLLLASFAIVTKLFSQHYPETPTWATATFLILWLIVTGTNMWIGVNKAGYSVGDELPVLLLLYGIPAIAAVLLRWKVL